MKGEGEKARAAWLLLAAVEKLLLAACCCVLLLCSCVFVLWCARRAYRLDDIIPLYLYIVEMPRGDHPWRQLAPRAGDPPAQILLGVESGAGDGRVDIDVGIRLAEMDLVVRDLEVFEHA